MLKIGISFLFLTMVSISYGQLFEEFMKVLANDRGAEEGFGWSVAIDGNRFQT